jgi:hypothetical protein
VDERDALPGTSGIAGNEWDRAVSSGIERDRRERSEVRGMGTGALMLTLALALAPTLTLTLALGDETAMRRI